MGWVLSLEIMQHSILGSGNDEIDTTTVIRDEKAVYEENEKSIEFMVIYIERSVGEVDERKTTRIKYIERLGLGVLRGAFNEY